MSHLRSTVVCCLVFAAARLGADVPPALAAPTPAPGEEPPAAAPKPAAAPATPPPGPAEAPPPAGSEADHATPVAVPEVDLPAEPSGAAALPADVIAKAAARLKELVARQDSLLAAGAKPDADMDNVKRDLQTLLFDYDDYLRTYPTFAPGYVTYGLLLGKVGMRRESAAILLKANELDPDLPIVKNQLGNYLAEEGEPLEAVSYFLAAIRLAPNEPLYHYQLGRLLAGARDDFLKSGQWSRAQLDEAMHHAFQRAAELAPDNIEYSYGYAESFYELANPNWDDALKVWGALEDRVDPGLEKETIRLQAANILIKQRKFDHARMLLATITDPALTERKQKLLDQLAANPEK
jgi:tetratricopeptide (TPR) repeat protein